MYRCVTNLPGGWLSTTIIAYSAHESSVWAEFGRVSLSLLHQGGAGWGLESWGYRQQIPETSVLMEPGRLARQFSGPASKDGYHDFCHN